MKHKIKLIIFAGALCIITLFATKVFASSAWLEWTETGDYYNYAPSYIATSDTERYMYYCKNKIEGEIVDHIYMRKITGSGTDWTWSAPSLALSPSASGWDSVHICDPDVKKGSFLYNGHTYSYIMFYLGSDRNDNNHNQIGVAFADSLSGPWTKWAGNPLISFSGISDWGVGQPSATSVNGQGRLLLFYTRGDQDGTRMVRRDINLADMSSISLGSEVTIPTNGLTESDGSPVILHNGALAYDGKTDRFYLVRPRHPFDTSSPSYVATNSQIAYTSGSTIWDGAGTWTVEGHVTPIQSGKNRNHNSTLLTDVWGNLKGGANYYQVNFTGSDTGSFPGNLWTYRIHGIGKDALGAPSSPSAFKIAILPDTQKYAAFYPSIFGVQTQWLADNYQAQNIKFVIHVGDIVDDNSTTQWQVAKDAMRKMDGFVPYSVLPGNHDMGTGGSSDTRDTTLYNNYFPLSHYSGTSTFGGVYPAEPGKYDNNYHTFSAGGTDWLVLSLEFGPRDPVLDWANQVVSSHPDHRVIVATHTYMFNDETRQNSGHSWNPHNYGVASEPGGVNDGEEMWNKFIKLHPNISIVVNGHVLGDGQGRRVSIGDHGNKVYQMLVNYQMQTNGGNGYLRLLEIDPVHGILEGISYSPYLNQYYTDWQNDFLYRNVEFGPPTASNLPVLLDNFNDGNLDGWTIVDEGTIDAPSNWSVSSGRVAQTSNIYGPTNSATDNRKGTFAYYNKASALNWNNYSVEAILNSTDNDGIGLMFYYKDANNYYKVDLDSQRNFKKLFKMKNGIETTLAASTGAYTVDSDMTLKVKVRNGKITVTLNGADLFGTVTDSDLTSGTVAMYSWGNQNSHFDDVKVQPAGSLLADDFNDGNMNGWSIVDEGTVSAPSNWSVVRGEVQQSSNIHGPDTSAVNNRKGTFAYYNNSEAFSWANYSLSAVLRSTDNDGIGLMFRYQNANNYYKLDLDKERNFRKLFKVVNGVETTLANVAVPGYTQGANFNLEVKIIGNQIQVFQDEVDIFGGPITDNSLLTGTVGLYSWGNQNSYFDDVAVDPQ